MLPKNSSVRLATLYFSLIGTPCLALAQVPNVAVTSDVVASAAPEPEAPSAAPAASAEPTKPPAAAATAPESAAAPVVSDKGKPPEADTPAESSEVKLSATFGKGATIATADEKFSVNLRGRIQAQALVSDEDGAGGEVTQFQIRRMRLVLQGNLWGPELQYYIQLAFSNRDMEPDLRSPLRDAYVTYAPFRDLNVRFGQMKVPYGRQRVTSSSALGMVDRSAVTTELNLDRDVGVQALSKNFLGVDEKIGYSLGVFGGDGRNRVADNAGYLFVGRLNFMPLGHFDDNVETDSKREKKARLAIGLGGAYNQATNRPQSTIGLPFEDPNVRFSYAHLGVDFMFKYAGFFATSEWMMRTADAESIDGVAGDGSPTTFLSRQAWGAFGQVGQMLTESLEVSARYGHLSPIGTSAVTLLNEIGGGLSYYFDHHNLKLQSDYFYFSGASDFSAGSHQGRLQAQVFF